MAIFWHWRRAVLIDSIRKGIQAIASQQKVVVPYELCKNFGAVTKFMELARVGFDYTKATVVVQPNAFD